MSPFTYATRSRLLNSATFLAIILTPLLAVANEELGLQVPPGFEITLFADDDLATDIYSMAIDSFGRVVVAGRGYVRILTDTDHDGVADSAKQYVDGPLSGAHGLVFDGAHLICSGDAGLLRYVDRDGDDQADGPAEVLLKVKAGGEHDIHAVRKGPDGWWYLVAGNMAGITADYASLPHSPVKQPTAGTLLRLTPDFAKSEVIAHGFRNAYDFDFHALGDLFTYDSDGERDVSLPWYRPTRVFHVLPGSHAGWLSRSWKRPAGFFDMPPVMASFGRGSPTGVVCYRHTQFPKKYRNTLFVLDWTYGRVMALPLRPDRSVWQSDPEEFITAVGQFGFAPTDVEVAPDGSLYVSVGGRGTRGGVYRIRFVSAEASTDELDNLTRCLTAPQPLSSWSRRAWEPIADRLGAKVISDAATDDRRSLPERIRAIEILTERFAGIDADCADKLTRSNSAAVRARVAWSLGRSPTRSHHKALLDRLLGDDDPLTVRMALEVLVGQSACVIDSYAAALSPLLGSEDPFVRQTAARVAAGASMAIGSTGRRFSADAWIASQRSKGCSTASVDIALQLLSSDQPGASKRDAARAAQIALGDVGPASDVVPVFEGYTCQVDLEKHAKETDALIAAVADLYPTNDPPLNHELGRLIAMLRPCDTSLFDRVLSKITDTSDPVKDIHQLIILARMPVERTADHRERISAALTALEFKIEAAGLHRDSNWDDRIAEMYTAQVQLDPLLPTALLRQSQLGEPGHALLLDSLEGDQLQEAADKFLARMNANSDYHWTGDVVRLLGKSKRPDARTLLRAKVEDFSVRSSILTVLAAAPDTQDRELFVAGLENDDVGLLSEMIRALGWLGAGANPTEHLTLVRTLRRLGPTPEERTIQDAVIRLLRNSTRQSFGYQLGQPPTERQTSAIAEWSTWAESEFPQEWARQTGGTSQDAEQLDKLLTGIDWDAGDAARGETVFQKRSCAQCHGSSRALGPDLAGAASRFSRRDLFIAIAMPNRDVSPRYQTTLIVTDDGRMHSGRVIYGSVDGLVFRTSANETLRIETNEIAVQRPLTRSLMPSGLLIDLKPSELADLYAYLSSLDGRSPQ